VIEKRKISGALGGNEGRENPSGLKGRGGTGRGRIGVRREKRQVIKTALAVGGGGTKRTRKKRIA